MNYSFRSFARVGAALIFTCRTTSSVRLGELPNVLWCIRRPPGRSSSSLVRSDSAPFFEIVRGYPEPGVLNAPVSITRRVRGPVFSARRGHGARAGDQHLRR